MVAIRFVQLFLAATVALALPIAPDALSELEGRQSGGATCGSHSYSSSNLNPAKNAGCNYFRQGKTVGSGSYPHRYNDYEGFDFDTASPWYEFPILANHQIFDGSTSPGADRVIFNGNCEFTAVLTHTGASGNNFNECNY